MIARVPIDDPLIRRVALGTDGYTNGVPMSSDMLNMINNLGLFGD